jgi:uncharacterized protein with HEPN domain
MSSLHKPEKLLYDILTSSKLILKFTEGIDKSAFKDSEMISSACERKFEIIGEAFNRLKQKFPSVAGTFPELNRIIGFRNIIIHGYDIIDSEIIWQTIQTDVPNLIARIEEKLPHMDY